MLGQCASLVRNTTWLEDRAAYPCKLTADSGCPAEMAQRLGTMQHETWPLKTFSYLYLWLDLESVLKVFEWVWSSASHGLGLS